MTSPERGLLLPCAAGEGDHAQHGGGGVAAAAASSLDAAIAATPPPSRRVPRRATSPAAQGRRILPLGGRLSMSPSDARTVYHRRRRPHSVPQGWLQARPLHARRPRRPVRPPAAAAPALRAGRLRPGDPRLREHHRRRAEPRPGGGAPARLRDGHGGLHRGDQLRLGHAVHRPRLPVHPRRPVRHDPGRGRGEPQPTHR